ncbi:MAG: DNA adenine methylase [Candidatus Hydrogenedentes bacterium]|nr:DNA adenine methylase [Candidatus Hydrogenedentota bacterium]
MITETLPFDQDSQSRFAAEPVLKWAGGKTQLLPRLQAFFPKQFGTYFEPFVGSGAVFFFLRRLYGSFPAELGDANAELINCYQVLRNELGSLIPAIEKHHDSHSLEHYYHVRRLDPTKLSSVERAARLIYLNKTCYNGLYRVNARGEFNVPVGSYKNPRIYDERSMAAVADALKGAQLKVADFSDVCDRAKARDFIYMDPPYYSETTGFTGYAVSALGEPRFGADEHRRLFQVATDLANRGCYVVVSNSDTFYIRRLYKDFHIHTVEARRAINSNGAGRGPVKELVITN